MHLAGQTLLRVLNDVLDFSKMEAGKLDLRCERLDVRTAVKAVAGIFQERARQKALRLECAVDDAVPALCMGDGARLQQILGNLVGNAIKFTARGSIAIRVALQELSGDAVVLTFAVTDTGVGIAADGRERLFEPFYQISAPQAQGQVAAPPAPGQLTAPQTHGEEGTGLGLAICRRLVGFMGGTLSVESSPGHGSEFRFTARLGRAHVDQPGAVRTAPAMRPGIAGRILVVDDNRINRLVARRMVELLGATAVDESASAQDALERCQRHDYDIVLMDIHMPGLNGLDGSAQLRHSLPPGRQPVIIALSADILIDRQMLRSHGIDDFMTKPISLEVLSTTPSRWLAGGPAEIVKTGGQ
jgi:CheY-like chemotaxis protein